jgi:SWI/SNF-related matrix-associated actin-dependent regulator of chromatin subfamily A3
MVRIAILSSAQLGMNPPLTVSLLFSIIFSEWRKTLEQLASLLSREEIPFVQIDGSLSLPARRKVLDAFHTDDRTAILLMTLGTGAIG